MWVWFPAVVWLLDFVARLVRQLQFRLRQTNRWLQIEVESEAS